ncbi:MAG: hypothetical protein V5B44_24425 [Candidatus Accumulibacter necessarius]|jgi:hypothetical protein|uniref:hypothetical protein n=1 Tax=Candidatus Accumulibacter necessarius TaxID=2954386 RepID=UPI002FC3073A
MAASPDDAGGSESDAGKFLSQALAEMLDLPWVEGGSWVAGTRQRHLWQRVAFSSA